MEFKNIGKHMSEYFRYRLGQKTVAFILLLFFNFNIFSEIVQDPASIGTKVTRTASGVDQIDIARPNVNGTSYNSLRELQVGERGLILNNNKNVVVQTEIAGLVAQWYGGKPYHNGNNRKEQNRNKRLCGSSR